MSLVGDVPVAPADVVANGGNEALEVSWDWGGLNIAADPTISGVQIFCQRAGDTQVFATGSFSPAYQTPAMLCPNSSTAAAATAGRPFSNFDPKYLCSGLIPSTATSYRIKGLQNGINYSVGVAAVDKFGNIGANASVVYGMPGGGTSGTGGTLGTGGALGSGGAAGVSPPDGAAGVADAGTGVRLANGCSCDIRGKHDRRETAGILWLALVTLAFAFKSLRSRPRVVCRRQAND